MQPVVNYDHKTIQVRRGSTTEWRRYGAICIPAEGEICVEFFQDANGSRNGNTGMKVGNGSNSYADLPYLITNQNQDDRISDEQINNWDMTVEKLANLVASEVGQVNPALGDNVQEALDDLHNRLLAIDPDGGSIEINDIPGLEDALKDKADKDHTHDEYLTDAPNDTKQYVRQSKAWAEVNIPDGAPPSWDEITDKPAEFPPEAHSQDWSTITNTPADFPPSAHDHAWDEITDKPSTYPPEDHTHDQYALGTELEAEIQARIAGDNALEKDIEDLEAAIGAVIGQLAFGGSYDASTGLVARANISALTEGQPLPDYSQVTGTFVIVVVAGNNPEELDEADWLVAGEAGWVAIKYGTAGSVLWENVVGAPDFLTDAQGSIDGDSKEYVRKNGEWVESSDTSLWQQNGDDIYYNEGNVGIGTSDPDVDLHIYKSNPIIKMEHVGNNSSRFYFESTTDGAWGCIQASNESGNRRLLFAPNNGTGDARYGGLTLHTDKAEIGGEFATNYGLNVHGKVGIGTDTVATYHQLHIQTEGIAGAIIEATDAGGYSQQTWKTPEGEWVAGMRPESSGNFIIRNAAVGNLVYVTPSGHVGIGTDSPAGNSLTIEQTGTARLRLAEKGVRSWDMEATGGDWRLNNATNSLECICVKSDGRVGIGGSPDELFTVNGGNTLLRSEYDQLGATHSYVYFQARASGNWRNSHIGVESNNLVFATGGVGTDYTNAPNQMILDPAGRLGIGGTPSRSAKEIEEEAEATLRNWDSKDKKPTKAELIKQLTERTIGGGTAKLQVAGDAYFNGSSHFTGYVYKENNAGIAFAVNAIQPVNSANTLSNGFVDIGESGRRFKNAWFSETVTAKKFVGDGSGLTNLPGGSGGGGSYTAGEGITIDNTANTIAMSGSYNGDFTVNGTVNASVTKAIPDSIYWKNSAEGTGLRMSSSEIYPVDADNNALLGNTVSIGAPLATFKEGNFTGYMNAGWFGTLGNGAVRIGSRNNQQHFFATNDAGDNINGTADLGFDDGSVAKRWRNGYFTGTVDAGGFTVNGSPISAGGDYVPLTGNSTVSGTITATDFIATSDERLKDNITPIPVGLIDDIKPVSWDWKDGGKSAGVVAQQLQAIGLDDYVHENDDGQLGVNYQALTAILLAEVIDLKRRLAE